jgi:uncharacterized protein YkwD
MCLPLPAHLARFGSATRTALLLVVAALLATTVTTRPAAAATVEDTFTSKLNAARTTRDIPRLTVRNDLASVADAQARRMANRSVLYHNPHLASDVKNWRWFGENVGYGPSARAIHRAFMRSAPHKANILDRHYTEVGIGVVVKDGRVWVAEVFRQPLHRATYLGTVRTLATITGRDVPPALLQAVIG